VWAVLKAQQVSELGGRLLGDFPIEIPDHGPCAQAGQAVRNRAADAASGTRHDRRAAAE
jgi:hypothetical protein